jgi:hypothetical protein
MTTKENIILELTELKSRLATVRPQQVYTVPAGYFEGLANQVFSRIKALEAGNATDELSYLAPSLIPVSRHMPHAVPPGYFEGLAETLIRKIREQSDTQTAREELETLSPFLSGLKKTIPYAVPGGYFEGLGETRKRPAAKMVSITHRRWFRFAAAAVVTGLIAMTGLIYFSSRNAVDPVDQPYAWVKKSIKKVDKADIDSFVKLADEELSNQAAVASNPVKPEEIKELMKDVSDQEIQDFLETTPETEANVETLMN